MRRKAYHLKPPSLAKAKRCRPYISTKQEPTTQSQPREAQQTLAQRSSPQPSAPLAQPSPLHPLLSSAHPSPFHPLRSMGVWFVPWLSEPGACVLRAFGFVHCLSEPGACALDLQQNKKNVLKKHLFEVCPCLQNAVKNNTKSRFSF